MANKEIERLRLTIRSLEGVLKTSSDNMQRKRVHKDIQRLKTELESISQPSYEDDFDIDYSFENTIEDSDNPLEHFYYLKHIPIFELNPHINNRELNELHSFLKFFEEEYVGIIGEYHLKLDYNRAQARESFYSSIHDIRISMNNYSEVLEKIQEERVDMTAQTRLKMESQAEYRTLLNKMGDFYRKLYKFVNELVNDFESGGNLITNPQEKLKLSKDLPHSMVLQGCTVIEGLKDLHNFITEVLNYHNFPDIKKSDNDKRPF